MTGWIRFDILRNRNIDTILDNQKQEWIVEKKDDMIRFESKTRPHEYLNGDPIYPRAYNGDPSCNDILPPYGCWYQLYVGHKNPTWWIVKSADGGSLE